MLFAFCIIVIYQCKNVVLELILRIALAFFENHISKSSKSNFRFGVRAKLKYLLPRAHACIDQLEIRERHKDAVCGLFSFGSTILRRRNFGQDQLLLLAQAAGNHRLI
ncbi:hypothetical protein WJ98_01240 [Burkholderia ubonensis]|nr:hypothetical protein WJ98_01240 [Burkholderia ubonensis]KWB61815.1 hypothetical protein WL38_24990 [Burkholderia ubonensis]